jgi:septum site-determining protein MinC
MNKPQEKSVRLKGVGDSLWVTLNPRAGKEDLKQELDQVFSRLNNIAIGARVILDTGDTTAENSLLDLLSSHLKDVYKVGTVEKASNRSPGEQRVRQRDVDRSWHNYRSDVLMLAGRVRSGQTVTAKKHLLILGDVNPGAEVSAGGDIFILGSLFGKALAGQPGKTDSIIFSLNFKPTQIQIGELVAAGLPENPEKKPEFASVEDGNIVVEDYITKNPFGRISWPKVR